MTAISSSFTRVATWSKACVAAVAVAGSLGIAANAWSQGYFTDFDAGYTNGASLSGSQGWDTNDPDKTPTTTGYNGEYVGQSDYVGTVTGYTNAATGNWAYLGGGEHGTTYPYVLPGATTIYTYHPFTLGTTSAYAFNVDMSIATSSAYPTRDSFGWTFLNSASGTTIGSNLFSLNFTPATSTNLMDISYSVNGGANVATGLAIFYNSIYHLTISVNVTAKTANVTLTPTSGSPVSIASVNLAAINPLTVQEVAATWKLAGNTQDANGGYTSAGGNELLFNNYGISVPEPSTWAMLGVGAVALGVWGRRRVRA